MDPVTIPVTFSASSEDEAFVTVENTNSVAIRVITLDVDGTLVGFAIGSKYTGLIYPPSFTDNKGVTFDVFTCTGLNSLGKANLGPSGIIDPCARRDAQLPKNELQPEETMILRYVGKPTKVTYQEGSIVEVATGNNVLFAITS